MRLLLLLLLTLSTTGEVQADLLDDALASVGKTKADLGYHPKGYWNRYPYEVPYKLPAFDDLLAEPLRLYDYSQSMKAAFAHYMQDTTFANTNHSALYQLTYQLAWERRIGGFRNYTPNLIDSVSFERPLADALERLSRGCGAELEYRAFGQSAGGAISPALLDSLQKDVSPDIQNVLAFWINNVAEAYRYHQLAFRNVPPALVYRLSTITDIDATQGDGQKYYPEFDDCAAMLDWQSLVYAHFKVIAATDLTAKRLAAIAGSPRMVSIEIPTPLGVISLGDRGKGTFARDDYLLICDFGGDDVYRSGGGSSPTRPFSVIIDLEGNDTYGEELASRQFGYGNCGLGMLVDLSGDDHSRAERLAQGVGIFGTGLVLDAAGRDDYKLAVSGQGCGYFGVGMLFDRDGDDTYYLAGDGQGAGGIGGGIGILADYRGHDRYTAEPLASKFNRGDYHSQGTINANNAQGFGGGRRGDGSDGHSWAGGLGALIDCYGNDEYYSGNWTLGVGYWFGIGIVYDVDGNDLYRSCYFTQASGAHYCLGAMFDESGDDRHELYETAGAGISFGWDFAVTLLVDWSGNDSYAGKIISIANAQIRSNSLLCDFGGNDEYRLNAGSDGIGEATFRDDYRTPRPTAPFTWYAQSYAILIDVGGADRYLDSLDSTRSTQPRPGTGDNRTWNRPARDSERFGFDNYGIGVDADSGRVDDLFRFRDHK